MKKNKLFFNGRIYPRVATRSAADSMAVTGHRIRAIGKNLKYDPEFSGYEKIDLKGHAVLPGFVDAHTHFYFLALSMGNVKLDALTSFEDVLTAIKVHAKKLGPEEWIVGDGFSPDRWLKYVSPDRYMLDSVSGGRPAAIFSKDTHLMWVNSRALELAGLDARTPEPAGGSIVRLDNNEPSGILKEVPGYFPVYRLIRRPDLTKTMKLHDRALKEAYRVGITGVHSFDGLEALEFFDHAARQNRLGLRINYYAPAAALSRINADMIARFESNDYLRFSGVKIFADGALGSQTALCFKKYIGSGNNFGIEVTSRAGMQEYINHAAALNLPCAVHAIGDRAVANVLDCFEMAPMLPPGRRHRIEHLQMMRRGDLPRLKKLGIVASMQPSHCPSDVPLIEKYWGSRGRNCFMFNTLLKHRIPLAFGSDAPIEPPHPLSGIDAAVNRPIRGTKKSFYPDERISVTDAIHAFTAGPSFAAGMEATRGFLLPGYPADFIILTNDICRIPRNRIKEVEIAATFFDGHLVFRNKNFTLPL